MIAPLFLAVGIFIVGILMAVVLIGCSPTPEKKQLSTPSPSVWIQNPEQRFKVERVQVVYDEIAYEQRRGVYIIQDTKTGREYIGMSGVGISEIGSHSTDGENTARDER